MVVNKKAEASLAGGWVPAFCDADRASARRSREGSCDGAMWREGRLLRGFFQNSGMCLVILDTELRIVEYNTEFRRQIAPSTRSLIGLRFQKFVRARSWQKLRPEFNRLLTGQRPRVTGSVSVVDAERGGFDCEVTCVVGQGRTLAGRHAAGDILMLARPVPPEPQQPASSEGNWLLGELEARVLEGVAGGESTADLASKFYLSRQGVEYHVGSLLRRFRVPNRAALVAKAYAQGVLRTGSWPPQVTSGFVR